ncbi:MAG: hypothetical protein LBM13_01870 [Candidatus Ancillula sp.]|jgi:plasmid stabilization system protein ParE|nr:hypothetical protein [Candidatus Ancillula sp.]
MFSDDVEVWSVDTLREVDRDIAQLTQWYGENGDGKKSELKFADSVARALRSLTTFPRNHRMWEDEDTIRRFDLPSHNVAIIYFIDDDYLEVIAVQAFHTLADPERYNRLITERVKIAKARHPKG